MREHILSKITKYLLTISVICFTILCSLSCSDDDNNDYKEPSTDNIVPYSIKYTDKVNKAAITFNYSIPEDNKRIKTFTVTNNIERTPLESAFNHYTIIYDNDGKITALMDGSSLLYSYDYSIYKVSENDYYFSDYDELWSVTKKQGDEEIAEYLIDRDGYLVYWETKAGNGPYIQKSYLIYSDKNIRREIVNITISGSSIQYYENIMTYGSQNSIFKNVTTPKWFIATEFEHFFKYQLTDCVEEYNSGEDIIGEFTYPAFEYGFPTQIEMEIKIRGMKEWDRQYEIIYNKII